jgi:hypothetical protein
MAMDVDVFRTKLVIEIDHWMYIVPLHNSSCYYYFRRLFDIAAVN